MTRWSQDELNRTIDEVKRRSVLDPQFRMLALSQPLVAVAKINPKPLPTGLSVTFIDGGGAGNSSSGSNHDLIISLAPLVANADELSDEELEEAAGGKSDLEFPIE